MAKKSSCTIYFSFFMVIATHRYKSMALMQVLLWATAYSTTACQPCRYDTAGDVIVRRLMMNAVKDQRLCCVLACHDEGWQHVRDQIADVDWCASIACTKHVSLSSTSSQQTIQLLWFLLTIVILTLMMTLIFSCKFNRLNYTKSFCDLILLSCYTSLKLHSNSTGISLVLI